MLETGIIGIGNAGSQVAVLANKRLGIDALVINSSDKDLETIPSGITSILIGDSNGSGKNRKEAQKFLKGSIASIVTNEDYANIFSKDVLFVASSTGGGTGSGASIIMANIVSEISKTTKVIIIGILPTIKEGLSTQLN